MTQTVDVNQAMMAYLEANLPTFKFYAGVNFPPAEWTPADGPTVTFKVRGGPDTEARELLTPSYQFKIYGTDPLDAWGSYQALDSALVEPAADLKYVHGISEMFGQPSIEPDSLWDYVLAYYQVYIRNI